MLSYFYLRKSEQTNKQTNPFNEVIFSAIDGKGLDINRNYTVDRWKAKQRGDKFNNRSDWGNVCVVMSQTQMSLVFNIEFEKLSKKLCLPLSKNVHVQADWRL